MIDKIKKYRIFIALASVSVTMSLAIGFDECICTNIYGFPIPFIIDSVGCRRSELPINTIALAFNFTCHFFFWLVTSTIYNGFKHRIIDMKNFLLD